MPGDPFYRSAAWLKARGKYLADHRTCEAPRCGQPSSHVDHRLSRARGGASLDPSNFMALCPSCHSRKTARQDGGFGHAQSRQRPVGSDGWPVDVEALPAAPAPAQRVSSPIQAHPGVPES
jgi:5-methylcytosine-specific restriction endonuclease McrA